MIVETHCKEGAPTLYEILNESYKKGRIVYDKNCNLLSTVQRGRAAERQCKEREHRKSEKYSSQLCKTTELDGI